MNPKDVALLARDDHVIAKCAKMVERNPVVVRCEAPLERRKQRDGMCITVDLEDQSAFCDENVARGEQGYSGPDVDGAIVRYFSRQEPNPGVCANNVTFPLQST